MWFMQITVALAVFFFFYCSENFVLRTLVETTLLWIFHPKLCKAAPGIKGKRLGEKRVKQGRDTDCSGGGEAGIPSLLGADKLLKVNLNKLQRRLCKSLQL